LCKTNQVILPVTVPRTVSLIASSFSLAGGLYYKYITIII
jgi:hypothetical protein